MLIWKSIFKKIFVFIKTQKTNLEEKKMIEKQETQDKNILKKERSSQTNKKSNPNIKKKNPKKVESITQQGSTLLETDRNNLINAIKPSNRKICKTTLEIKKTDLNLIFEWTNTINKAISHLSSKIDNIKYSPSPKFSTDYLTRYDFSVELTKNFRELKKDFKCELTNKFRELEDLKEVSENLEIVPKKVTDIENQIKELSEKLDNLPSNTSKTNTAIPTEEKAVIDLAKYMSDGIVQFENIAKEYLSKIQELENIEKLKNTPQIVLKSSKTKNHHIGKKEGEVELIRKIAKTYPTEFQAIKSLFKTHLKEKYAKDEEINITNENKNEMILHLEGEVELGKYKVIIPAILLDGKVIFTAQIEKNEN